MNHLLSGCLALAVVAITIPVVHAENPQRINDSAIVESQRTESSFESGGATSGSSTSEPVQADGLGGPDSTQNSPTALGGNAAGEERWPPDRPGDRGPKPDKWD